MVMSTKFLMIMALEFMNNLFTNEITKEIQIYLRQYNQLLYSFVEDMVEPMFSTSISTACVQFSKNEDKKLCIKFLFNKEFWDGLNYNEKTFLFTHEVLHVIFQHGYNGRKFVESLPKEKQSHELLNIAQDICINHIILNSYHRNIPKIAMPFLNDACFIETVFKQEHISEIKKGQSFEYYYLKYIELYGLEENPNVQTLDQHNNSGCGGDTDLENKLEGIEAEEKDNSENNSENVSEEDLNEDLNEDLKDALSDHELDDLDETSNHKALEGGNDYSLNDISDSNSRAKKEVKKEKTLDDLFKVVIKSAISKKYSVKKKRNWYGFNRRTSLALKAMSPDLTLPIVQDHREVIPERHKICIYLDFSGSCEYFSQRFMELVGYLPEDKYDVEMYAFASSLSKVRVTIKNNKKYFSHSYIGYGTDISRVIHHHKKLTDEGNKYDAVFILTDGFYCNIQNNTIHDYSKWHFFMTPHYSKNLPKDSKFYVIDR